MSNDTPATQVVWFDIPCIDLDRAIRFYEAVLNCKIDLMTNPEFSMGILPHGGSAIGGCLYIDTERAGSDGGPLLYLNCNGRLDTAAALVEAKGGHIEMAVHQIGPHGSRAVIKDSEGNRVALHSANPGG